MSRHVRLLAGLLLFVAFALSAGCGSGNKAEAPTNTAKVEGKEATPPAPPPLPPPPVDK